MSKFNKCGNLPCDRLKMHIQGSEKEDLQPDTIEFADEYGWNITGCCHSCWVVQRILYCPFCGARLPEDGFNCLKEEE